MNMRIIRNKITTSLTFRWRLLVRVNVLCFSYSLTVLFCRNLLGCDKTFRLSAHVVTYDIAYLLTLLLVTWHCNIPSNETGSDHFPRPRFLVWLYQQPIQFKSIRVSSFIYNGDDINMITAEFWLTKMRPASFFWET